MPNVVSNVPQIVRLVHKFVDARRQWSYLEGPGTAALPINMIPWDIYHLNGGFLPGERVVGPDVGKA